MRRPFRLGHLAGIDVRGDPSWPFVGAGAAATVAIDVAADHGRPVGVAFGLAVVVTAGLFVSVLAHGLARACEAARRGAGVRSVTLVAFGGTIERAPALRRPRTELAVTAVGVFTALVLAAAFGIAATAARVAGSADAALAAGMLGWLNVGLAAFNLLPGSPLDGGRLLHLIVERVTRNGARAATVATAAGMVTGVLVVTAGAAWLLQGDDGPLPALWLMGTGWLLVRSATIEAQMSAGQEPFEELPRPDLERQR